MQQRFRRGAISVGQIKCEGCDLVILPGDMYLSIDEKPSDKFKEEIGFIEEINCDECGKQIEDQVEYLFMLDGEGEKCYCSTCLKKKGGDAYTRKHSGKILKFEKNEERSKVLRFCQACCEKRKAGMEKKEKGERIYTFFTQKTGR